MTLQNIEKVLASLNSEHEKITNLVPGNFGFRDNTTMYNNVWGNFYQNPILFIENDNQGKIIIIRSNQYEGGGGYFFTRLNKDFTIDTSFTEMYFDNTYQTINYIGQQPNGKYLFSIKQNKEIVRLENDGTLDESYNVALTRNDNSPNEGSFAMLSDGSVLIGLKGYGGLKINGTTITSIPFKLGKIDSDGNIDNSFSCNFSYTGTDYPLATYAPDENASDYNQMRILRVDDDNIFLLLQLAGDLGPYVNGDFRFILKINSNGQHDTNFGYRFDFRKVIYTTVPYPQYAVINPGYYSNVIAVTNLFSNFNVLPSVLKDGIVFRDAIYGKIQNQNSSNIPEVVTIHAGTYFTSEYNTLKMNLDGTIDNAFSTNASNSLSYTNYSNINEYKNGKYLINGLFFSNDGTSYNDNGIFIGTLRKWVICLNNDGTLDESFLSPNSIDYIDSYYYSNYPLTPDPNPYIKFLNNEIYIFNANSINGENSYNIAKINPNGEVFPLDLLKPIEPKISFGLSDGYYWFYTNNLSTNLLVSFDDVKYYGFYSYYYNDFENFMIPYVHSRSMVRLAYEDTNLIFSWPKWSIPKEYILPKDGQVANGEKYFGPGSTYFTNYYKGTMVLAAKDINIEEYYCTGEVYYNDAYSSIDVFEVYNNKYTCVLKTNKDLDEHDVGDFEDEAYSIIHMVLIPGTSDGITTDTVEGEWTDDLAVKGLTGRDHLFHLTFVTNGYRTFTNEEAIAIAEQFLDVALHEPYTLYQVDLSPQLINMSTEGSMDTSIVDGVSQQRDLNMITTRRDGVYKTVVQSQDGNSSDNDLPGLEGYPNIKAN